MYIRHRASGTRGVCFFTPVVSPEYSSETPSERGRFPKEISLTGTGNPVNRKTSKTLGDIAVLNQNVDKHTGGEPARPLRLVPPGRAWPEPKFIRKVTSGIGGTMMPKIGIRAPPGGDIGSFRSPKSPQNDAQERSLLMS